MSPPIAHELDLIANTIADFYPSVGIALMPDGGARIEWTRGGTEIAVVLEASGAMFLHALDPVSGRFDESHFDSFDRLELETFLRGATRA